MRRIELLHPAYKTEVYTSNTLVFVDNCCPLSFIQPGTQGKALGSTDRSNESLKISLILVATCCQIGQVRTLHKFFYAIA